MSADFNSGAVLVDMRGNDEKLPGTDSLTDPGELLLLTDIAHPERMQFVVLNEALDRSSVEAWDRTHKVPPALAAPANNGVVAKPGVVQPLPNPKCRAKAPACRRFATPFGPTRRPERADRRGIVAALPVRAAHESKRRRSLHLHRTLGPPRTPNRS